MSPSEGSAWRPIDTAPADETIMIFSLRWGPIIAEFSSEFQEWLSRMQCPASLTGQESGLTHWRPLPQTPEGISPEAIAAARNATLA